MQFILMYIRVTLDSLRNDKIFFNNTHCIEILLD